MRGDFQGSLKITSRSLILRGKHVKDVLEIPYVLTWCPKGLCSHLWPRCSPEEGWTRKELGEVLDDVIQPKKSAMFLPPLSLLCNMENSHVYQAGCFCVVTQDTMCPSSEQLLFTLKVILFFIMFELLSLWHGDSIPGHLNVVLKHSLLSFLCPNLCSKTLWISLFLNLLHNYLGL